MRSLAAVLLVPFIACAAPGQAPAGDDDQTDAGTGVDPGGLPIPERGFQIQSPMLDIQPGAEVTYCYYFRTPNTSELSIKQWVSRMTPGSHHMILYLTPSDQQPPGTVSTNLCGISSGSTGPVWTYSAQTADAQAILPDDDGEGNPVGQVIPAGQSGFLQMHYLNASDNVIHARVVLNAVAYPDRVQVTPAAPYVTFNRQINIGPVTPAGPTKSMVSGTCPVPMESGKPPRFYVMTTHTHKQGVHTFVKDGEKADGTTIFDSTSWEHPGATAWDKMPFFQFTSGKLSYQCEYENPNNRTIKTGDSAETDEMCMAIGYYFPAPGSTGHFCLNSALIY